MKLAGFDTPTNGENYLDKNSFALLVDSYNKRHWEEFVKILLQKHYDPSYLKSINNNFTQFKKARIFKSENYSGNPELHRAMAESVSKTFR